MSVVVAVEQLGPCRKQFQIEVPAPAVEAELDRVAGEYGRKARIPGFRKGKVPAAMVRRHFREEVEKEAVERLVPRYWKQAQAETRVEPMLPPEVRDVRLEPGAPLTFTATVETRPEFELRNVRDFSLPEMDVRPADEEIDRAVEDLRGGLAEWPPAGRPAARGDRVEARVAELSSIVGADGAAQPSGEHQPVVFQIGDPAVWEELSLAATGLAPGRAVDFERKANEGEIARIRRYRLQVDAVGERRLPAVDDAFAQRVGKFETLEALRTDLAERIAAAKRLERRRRREQAVLDQLRERHPLELPPGVVENEQKHLLHDYADGLAERGIDPAKAEIDWQGLAGEVKPQAERRVHSRILLDAIAEAEAVTVGEDEFEAALVSIARVERRSPAEVRQALDRGGKLGALRAQLRREKTLRRLTGDET